MFFIKKQNWEPEGKDRRESPRVSAEDEFVVDFQTKDFGRRPGFGAGKDLSLTGVRFATFAPLKKGQTMEITLTFSKHFTGKTKIGLEAEVIRVYRPKGTRHFRIGCRFLHLEDYCKEVEIIRQFIWWVNIAKEPSERKSRKAA